MEQGVDPERLSEKQRREEGCAVLRHERHKLEERTIIAAPAQDLRNLADRIRKIADAGEGKAFLECTDEAAPEIEASLRFEVISEEELRRRASSTAPRKIKNVFLIVFYVVLLGLSLFGAYSLLWIFLQRFT